MFRFEPTVDLAGCRAKVDDHRWVVDEIATLPLASDERRVVLVVRRVDFVNAEGDGAMHRLFLFDQVAFRTHVAV